MALMGPKGLLKRLTAKDELEIRGVPESGQKAFGMQMKCTYCSGSHLEAQCWKKYPEKKPRNQDRNNQRGGGKEIKPCPKCGNRHSSPCRFRGKCHNCQGDHAKRVCPKNTQVAKLCFGPQPEDEDSDDDDYDSLIANRAVWGKTHANIGFDTCANTNVTPYKNSMENYRPETTATIQGVGKESTTIAGTGLFKFGLRDKGSDQIIEMEFPKAVHLPGTSQPLISCHRVHRMCRRRGWKSRSEQVYESGVLEIDTGQGRFSFGMVPIDGVYVFDPKDVFEPNIQPKPGEFNGKDVFRALKPSCHAAKTRSQRAKGGAEGATVGEPSSTVETQEPVEEQKTPAEINGPTGEPTTATEETEPAQERKPPGEQPGGAVYTKTSTEGGSYAPASPGDGAGFSELDCERGSSHQQRGNWEQQADMPGERFYRATGSEGCAEPT